MWLLSRTLLLAALRPSGRRLLVARVAMQGQGGIPPVGLWNAWAACVGHGCPADEATSSSRGAAASGARGADGCSVARAAAGEALELCTTHAAVLNAQPALVENERFLREKITIMSLLELIFT